jgi:hypothetical protein
MVDDDHLRQACLHASWWMFSWRESDGMKKSGGGRLDWQAVGSGFGVVVELEIVPGIADGFQWNFLCKSAVWQRSKLPGCNVNGPKPLTSSVGCAQRASFHLVSRGLLLQEPGIGL